MIDNIKIESKGKFYPSPSMTMGKEPFEKFGLSFYPRYNQANKYIYHSASLSNLAVKIYFDKMAIENSLHKFYHQNNYCDYTFKEILRSIEYLEDTFKISSDELKFKRVETAINIESQNQLHKLFNQYKLNEFEKMRKGKTIYGSKCFMSEYNLKAYDKHIETKLNNSIELVNEFGEKILAPVNTNRFEIDYRKMRPLNGILITLSDLKNNRTLLKLGNKIINYYDKVEIKQIYDYSILKSRERELVFAGQDSNFWDIEKVNMNTRKKKRETFNRCMNKLNSRLTNDSKIEIRNKLLDKINELIIN